ncbi:MAG: hypothetical protein EP330_18375 [Deltaproteobacteria bacterium]|nr:MAG: hypothetical protein EP330_18375 [Deltaproteobacteria bacterium]
MRAWLLLLLTPVAWAGDCPDFASLGADPAMAETRLAEAEAIYPQIYDRFTELGEIEAWVRDGVSCQTTPVSPELAARYHRFRALQADPLGGLRADAGARASASLAAALAVAPSLSFALPEDHGHRAVTEGEGTTVEVVAPLEGTLFFDGAAGRLRPTSRATFFQRADGDGAVVDSAYLYPDDPLPSYPVPEAVGTTDATTLLRVPPARAPLRTAAVGVGVGALALGAGSLIVRTNAMDLERSNAANAHAAQPLVNGLAVSSWTFGVASVGLFAGSMVVK